MFGIRNTAQLSKHDFVIRAFDFVRQNPALTYFSVLKLVVAT
jgi:hypothetical protein